jgi:hypothetical protein
MNALANRALLAFMLACVPSLLVGCNGGTTPPAIPASEADQHGIRSVVGRKTRSTKRVLKVISTESQPVKGGDPLTLKVDRAKNLFVTDVSGGKAGVIQEYKDGSFARVYSPDCAVSGCSKFAGLLADTVVDNNHVFAIMEQIQYKVGGSTLNSSGYEYWPKGNPSATPVDGGTVLNVGDSSHKIYQYALPLSYGGSPFNTLVPCSQGCDPHGFGLDSKDKPAARKEVGSISAESPTTVGKRSPIGSLPLPLVPRCTRCLTNKGPRLDQGDPLLGDLVLVFEVRH